MRVVDVSLPALSPRERGFLERYASGQSIAAIDREMGMSRSHLSSVYRPTVGRGGRGGAPQPRRCDDVIAAAIGHVVGTTQAKARPHPPADAQGGETTEESPC